MFWSKSDGSSWKINEFSDLRLKADFSDELLALVRRSIRRPISKPDVGYHLAKSIRDAKEIPQEILTCIEQSFDLANKD